MRRMTLEIMLFLLVVGAIVATGWCASAPILLDYGFLVDRANAKSPPTPLFERGEPFQSPLLWKREAFESPPFRKGDLGGFCLVQQHSASPHGRTVTVSDKLGNRVEVSVPVKRVVLLSLYELIPVLDLWDFVVGLNRWAFDNTVLKRCQRLEGIPVVGTGIDVSAEAILALHPELVITWSYRPEVVEFLSRKGLKVIAVYPDSLEELYEVIEMCGRLFQKEGRAKEVRSRMDELFYLVKSRAADIPPDKRRKVLWLWQKPTRVTGRLGLQQDLMTMIGAVNSAQTFAMSHAEVSLEQILGWNPEVIFIWGHASYGPADLLGSSQWQTVKAVKEGRVYKAPLADTWSPSTGVLTLWMAQKTYPEYFAGIDPGEIARQFHQECFGVSLAEGIFD
jgi:iron complex transport system substrate-binding protein